jgi:hypothetical protein
MAVIESAETECMVFTEHFACVRTIELRWFRARELIGLGSARTPKSLRAEGACKSVPATPEPLPRPIYCQIEPATSWLARPSPRPHFSARSVKSELGKCDAMSPVERNWSLNIVAFKPAAYGFQNAASDSLCLTVGRSAQAARVKRDIASQPRLRVSIHCIHSIATWCSGELQTCLPWPCSHTDREQYGWAMALLC